MDENEIILTNIRALSYRFLLKVLQTDLSRYGDYTVENGEFRFLPREGARFDPDLVTEYNAGKTGGAKIKFFDKAAAVRLAKSIGIFDGREEEETEDLSCTDELFREEEE